MTLAATFAAARQRIADGREPPQLFVRWEPVPGSLFGSRPRPLTFAERRAAYASVIETVRRIEEGQRYRRLRALIIAETPECREIIAAIRQLENLPFGMSMEREAAPMRAELEAIIEARMAEQAPDLRVAA